MNNVFDHVFSPTEFEILKIIGRKKMTISQIVEVYFEGSTSEILDANNLVAGVVRRINKKCRFYKMDWFLKGEGTGRHGKKVWKAKK